MTVIDTVSLNQLRECQITYIAKNKQSKTVKTAAYLRRERNDIAHSHRVQKCLAKDSKKLRYQARARNKARQLIENAFFSSHHKKDLIHYIIPMTAK